MAYRDARISKVPVKSAKTGKPEEQNQIFD